MKAVVLIFPNQLFKNWCFPPNVEVYLIEEYLFFNQYKFHQQKIAFHRASMKFYESYLQQQGIEVQYISAQHLLSDVRKCLQYFHADGITDIHTFKPVDHWLEKRMHKFAQQIEFHWYENPSFINTFEELSAFFNSGKTHFHQTDFYKWQRKKWQILLEKGQPKGGKWTYDTENRKKYPKNKSVPKIQFPDSNSFWREAEIYTRQNFSHHYGEITENPIYPIQFSDAENWLENFLQHRLEEFGIYEDSIVQESNFLHHSVLSPLINVGLLTPNSVIEKTLSYAEKHNIPLNSLEGFIRQILGWREFIRGLYEKIGTKQRNSNYWHHKRKIPGSFYTATTGILPIDTTLKKLFKTGYVHHIERLMLLSNFMNLCGFSPNQVYQWFMEMFIDAYDWVMVPNIYGMSLFADGGLMSTKPYISGSNYIMKMSNFAKGTWQNIWDALFWNFLHQYRGFFLQNPRLSMLIRNWDQMDESKKQQHLQTAKTYLETL